MTVFKLGKSLVLAVSALFSFIWLGGCSMQRQFDDPSQAFDALVKSMRAGDNVELRHILGPDGDALLFSGDTVSDDASIKRFLTAFDQEHRFVALDDKTIRLDVGSDNWPMPIPVVTDYYFYKWTFDTEAGRQEILNRRIGRNELDTMQTCLAIVDAQREYAEEDPENVQIPVYAQRFFSDPGRKNGLYWETTENEPPSPLGEIAAEAESQGYTVPATSSEISKGPHPYHGYLFRILKSQGPSAPGGARDYMVGDHMLGGFGVIAYPAIYGTSGIMTFIINQDGTLYQRDLGRDTAKIAAKITTFDPDSDWQPVDPKETAKPEFDEGK
jgi:Protein of unknown function (DUF2950)